MATFHIPLYAEFESDFRVTYKLDSETGEILSKDHHDLFIRDINNGGWSRHALPDRQLEYLVGNERNFEQALNMVDNSIVPLLHSRGLGLFPLWQALSHAKQTEGGLKRADVDKLERAERDGCYEGAVLYNQEWERDQVEECHTEAVLYNQDFGRVKKVEDCYETAGLYNQYLDKARMIDLRKEAILDDQEFERRQEVRTIPEEAILDDQEFDRAGVEGDKSSTAYLPKTLPEAEWIKPFSEDCGISSEIEVEIPTKKTPNPIVIEGINPKEIPLEGPLYMGEREKDGSGGNFKVEYPRTPTGRESKKKYELWVRAEGGEWDTFNPLTNTRLESLIRQRDDFENVLTSTEPSIAKDLVAKGLSLGSLWNVLYRTQLSDTKRFLASLSGLKKVEVFGS